MIQLLPTARPDVADGILDSIGSTPLVRLRRYLEEPSIQLYAKLEASNPGGSAKDRPARQMIEHALQSGVIDDQTTIVESSSGNMGIGLAQVCRFYQLPFICVVDPLAQRQNIAIMQALGARIETVTESIDGNFLAARWAKVNSLLQENPHAWWPNQYANQQNPMAHFEGTIREIIESLNGDFDYVFVATSSTGTAQGCRDYLMQQGHHAKVVAVDAIGSVLFGGTAGPRSIPGLGAGLVPPLAAGQRFDEVRRVFDIECIVGCRRMADREAILVGGSAGGVLETVRSMSERIRGKTCVAILHDCGTRYLDTIYSDAWVQQQTGLTPQELASRITSTEPTSFSLVGQSG